MAENPVVRNLDDDYELSQLNPVYSKTKEGEASQNDAEDLLDKLPEKEAMKLRIAVFEAVVDDVVDDIVEEKTEAGDGVTEEDVNEEVAPMVEKATTLHLVPSSIKSRIPKIIARHLRSHDPMYELLSKTAHYVTAAMTTMEEEDTVVSEVLDEKPADTGVDITEETAVRTGDNTQDENNTVPTTVTDAVKFLAASSVNHRKATALVSKRFAGVLLNRTLHDLRHHLPEKFVKKYNLHFSD